MTEAKPKAPLVYTKEQLGFPVEQWKELDDETKQWYKNAAKEEMELLRIPCN